MNTEQIARVAHEVNRAYCQALGDNSQPTWEDAPEWQRASARMGVDLHTMGDFGPEASHISWMQQKLDDGWAYGPVKDPELKQHPCMVPFDQLPREQQAKDFLFRAVVHALRPAGSIPAVNMAFGQALEALKAGERVARAGWNGKGMWLVLVPGTPSAQLRAGTPYREALGTESCEILPHIDMWTVNAQGRRAMLPGWVASQTDMLADDWTLVD